MREHRSREPTQHDVGEEHEPPGDPMRERGDRVGGGFEGQALRFMSEAQQCAALRQALHVVGQGLQPLGTNRNRELGRDVARHEMPNFDGAAPGCNPWFECLVLPPIPVECATVPVYEVASYVEKFMLWPHPLPVTPREVPHD